MIKQQKPPKVEFIFFPPDGDVLPLRPTDEAAHQQCYSKRLYFIFTSRLTDTAKRYGPHLHLSTCDSSVQRSESRAAARQAYIT